MRTQEIKLYQYSELSEKAKEKARNWFLDGEWFDFEWDNLREDAKNVDIELDSWEYRRYLKAELLSAPETVCDKILKEHGEVCETYKTAKKYKEKFAELLKLYENDDPSYDDQYEELKEEFLKDISEDYRILTDKEFEYTESEEYIKDTMEANEYEFLEDGTRF